MGIEKEGRGYLLLDTREKLKFTDLRKMSSRQLGIESGYQKQSLGEMWGHLFMAAGKAVVPVRCQGKYIESKKECIPRGYVRVR